MRPFQISEAEWINLEQLVTWQISTVGKVYIWLLPNSPNDGHTTVLSGEYAERFIKLMAYLASLSEQGCFC